MRNLTEHRINSSTLIYRSSTMGPPGVRHATSALRELTSIGGVRTAPEREDYSESNYDEWSGYGGSLFA